MNGEKTDARTPKVKVEMVYTGNADLLIGTTAQRAACIFLQNADQEIGVPNFSPRPYTPN